MSRILPKVELMNFAFLTDKFVIFGQTFKQFESIADSFERISKSMGTFKDNLNDLDAKKLTDTKALFESMAVISKSGSTDELLKKYGDSLKETFKQLAELLSGHSAQVTNAVSASTASNAASVKAISNTVTNIPTVKAAGNVAKTATSAVPVTPPAPPVDMTPLLTTMQNIENLLRGGIKVKQSQF